jgi:hypothetical protein
MKAEEICVSLNLNIDDVLNIYPYGSHVYGNNTKLSDYDYIIVYKKSFLPSGAFKDNAISSFDRKIQGTCYSKSGFIDAINNYQMPALECIYLSDDKIVKHTMPFKMNKFIENDFCKKVISLASSSWHNAVLSYKDDNTDFVMKNIYHALRILDFGIQIKEHGKIIDYSKLNNLKIEIYTGYCKPKNWHGKFMEMCDELKGKSNIINIDNIINIANDIFEGSTPIDGDALCALKIACDKAKKQTPTLKNRF